MASDYLFEPPVSYRLLGYGGDCASRTFERVGGTVGQPTPGISGACSPALPTVNKGVIPPLSTSIEAQGGGGGAGKRPVKGKKGILIGL